MVEAHLCCDRCGGSIHAARTAALARQEAREQLGFRRIGKQDLCASCHLEWTSEMLGKRP